MNLPYCPDCDSRHAGQVPCGLTYAQRLRTIRLDPSATPTRTRVAYYDDDALKALGGDRKERREKFMDATKGRGPLDAKDLTERDMDELMPVVAE